MAFIRRSCASLGVAFFAICSIPAMAQDLSYDPVNPGFGGNPFNSAHLLGVAHAQNSCTDPNAKTSVNKPEFSRARLSGASMKIRFVSVEEQ